MVLVRALDPEAELVLVDPYTAATRWAALPQGAYATATATRLAVRPARPRGGPSVRWILERSQDVGRSWTGGSVDLVFIDGDHSYQGCREDWEILAPARRARGLRGVPRRPRRQARRPRGAGPTQVVDEIFRGTGTDGWTLVDEVDALVVVRRHRASS